LIFQARGDTQPLPVGPWHALLNICRQRLKLASASRLQNTEPVGASGRIVDSGRLNGAGPSSRCNQYRRQKERENHQHSRRKDVAAGQSSHGRSSPKSPLRPASIVRSNAWDPVILKRSLVRNQTRASQLIARVRVASLADDVKERADRSPFRPTMARMRVVEGRPAHGGTMSAFARFHLWTDCRSVRA